MADVYKDPVPEPDDKALRVQALLAEYDACLKMVDGSRTEMWWSAYILIGGALAGLVLAIQTLAGHFDVWIAWVLIFVAAGIAVLFFSQLVWHIGRLQRRDSKHFERAREIEGLLNYLLPGLDIHAIRQVSELDKDLEEKRKNHGRWQTVWTWIRPSGDWVEPGGWRTLELAHWVTVGLWAAFGMMLLLWLMRCPQIAFLELPQLTPTPTATPTTTTTPRPTATPTLTPLPAATPTVAPEG